MVDSKIKKAKNIDDLKFASKDLLNIIKSLQAKGVKVNHISNLIGQLNKSLSKKTLLISFTYRNRKNVCFIVMGSEGRNEQNNKTDQDNALCCKR